MRVLLALSLSLVAAPTPAQWTPNPAAELIPTESHWRIGRFDGAPIPTTGTHGVSFTAPSRFVLDNGCRQWSGRFGDLRFEEDRLSPVETFPYAVPDCPAEPDARRIREAYAALLDRLATFTLQPDGRTIAVQRISRRARRGPDDRPGPIGPGLTLVPDTVVDIAPLEGLRLRLDTATGMTPRRLGRDVPWLQFEDGTVAGFDGCTLIAARYRPGRGGLIVTPSIIQPTEGCAADPLGPALDLALSPQSRATLDGRTVVFEDDKRFAQFVPAGPIEEESSFFTAPGYRLAAPSTSFADETALTPAGGGDLVLRGGDCEAERVGVLRAGDRLALRRLYLDAGGFNDFRPWACNDETKALRENLLNRTLRVRKTEDGIQRWDADARAWQPWLRAETAIDLSPLYDLSLVLNEAADARGALDSLAGLDGRPPRLFIGPSQIGGHDGCNSGGGPYHLRDGQIRLDMWVQTQRGCGPDHDRIAAAYFRFADEDAILTLTGDGLRAETPDGAYSVYRIAVER